MKQLLREVFLPLDLALRDFRHIWNCIRNEKLHGVDDMLWERGKTVLEGATELLKIVITTGCWDRTDTVVIQSQSNSME